MYDGSDPPLEDNLKTAVPLLELCRDNEIILEVETGVVGGEEDGLNREWIDKEKLYTTHEDMLAVHKALSPVSSASFMLASTFANVHGVYKPVNVVPTPTILKDGQRLLRPSTVRTHAFSLYPTAGLVLHRKKFTRRATV